MKRLLIPLLIIIILVSGCIQTPSGNGEIFMIPEEISIYNDYLDVIDGKADRISDTGTIEGTIISITESEVCPYDVDPKDCKIDPYPKDMGIVRIDKIIDYKTYDEQVAEQPIEEPATGGDNTTSTPGYTGIDIPQKESIYGKLEEGGEVSTIFILTTRSVKVNYISTEPTGGPESETDIVEKNISDGGKPMPKTYKPIPKEGNYSIFTTKIIGYPDTSQKTLPGLKIGDKFSAEIRYDGRLYVEEYNIIGLKQITTNGAQQTRPAIYKNKIVWEDNRSGNWDIYLYDLETKQEKQITTNSNDQADPDIYGNKIVYADNRNGNVDIYLYNLGTGIERQITTNEAQQAYPKIFGNIIVWSDYRHTYGSSIGIDIYIYDLGTGKEKQLTSNKLWEGPFAIYENKIVWEDMWGGGKIDVYIYDLGTGNETRIELTNTQMSPDIYGNKIVWSDYNYPHVNGDVFLYDINTKNQTQITFSNLLHEFGPKIYDNKIVWTDQRNGIEDIYLYDLGTKQEKQITKDVSSQQAPEIYENKIVWQDNRNGNWDIYLYEISS